jgi:hypothetical protein
MIAAGTADGTGVMTAGGTVAGIGVTIIAMIAVGIAHTGITAMIADGAVSKSDRQTKPRPEAGVFS